KLSCFWVGFLPFCSGVKNISQIEHSRHRSVCNFLVNLMCGLIAYAHQPKKPSLGLGCLACLPA
ncbi:MAG TPA: hypothetical protein PKW33_17145, partial [Anaerolineaceae bacterium]|nr:hypothetical protein [Anaerolineaceae bacterium]HPN53326.1 hypothetical protein [Anaerolineaceae bacterium]